MLIGSITPCIYGSSKGYRHALQDFWLHNVCCRCSSCIAVWAAPNVTQHDGKQKEWRKQRYDRRAVRVCYCQTLTSRSQQQCHTGNRVARGKHPTRGVQSRNGLQDRRARAPKVTSLRQCRVATGTSTECSHLHTLHDIAQTCISRCLRKPPVHHTLRSRSLSAAQPHQSCAQQVLRRRCSSSAPAWHAAKAVLPVQRSHTTHKP